MAFLLLLCACGPLRAGLLPHPDQRCYEGSTDLAKSTNRHPDHNLYGSAQLMYQTITSAAEEKL